MGIGLNRAENTIQAIETQFPPGTANALKKKRKQVAACLNRLNEYAAALDMADTGAASDFAVANPGDFATFRDAIATPPLSPSPEDPNNGDV